MKRRVELLSGGNVVVSFGEMHRGVQSRSL